MLTPVILAGGNGTRLWPLSRRDTPKQFLALLGEQSLLQATLLRLEGLEVARSIVVCADAHRFLVAEQLREIGCEADIVLEPEGRDTAPAIALAALCQQTRQDSAGRDAPMLVLPSDHHLEDVAVFHEALQTALPTAGRGDLVTFGIVPTRAETGYGYLEVADVTTGLQPLVRFVEKPDAIRAREFANDGQHLWNSGMFLLRGDRYLEELRHWRPAMHASVEKAWAGRGTDLDFLRPQADAFAECDAESIDYAVMEQTRVGVVVPLTAGWSDVGSYQALWDVASKDDDGNLLRGDVIAEDTQDAWIQSQSRLVAALGISDLVVVETADAVLVADRHRVQEVKTLVARLQSLGRQEGIAHRRAYRPWGSYECVEQGARFQVKHIRVRPGARLSLQRHHHRAEHWIVVSGTARVTRGDETFLLGENQSTYIPLGTPHRLENPGRIELELIEVQSGAYLGEDDIVRLDDDYRRG
ncbi:mannose-1-phosphate guanylyltransferase/mannose-6-phosphate isomerase [Chromohalobacter sarecensis]|uniref:mannose-1-phosphate guanylyltransferase n=1 Tax=Chromohalobacter sarecensis TaxID=245294 RepID=A0ABV9D2F3_9GAMM|nr:mannose-1-phosphate guanylyltransferase/mannose-6-phosphate isomerase [Chromohalobacter sarecensis]MCK0715886.1 mannose-1-phosphate guanylyltransferase/mannose-6-phosphate isomerase [Chromohalobacter sarecensis]